MSKKHFTELAKFMKRNRNMYIDEHAFDRACNELADICIEANPLFSRATFLRACGVK